VNKYNCVFSGVASDFEFENYHIFKSKILKAKKDSKAKLFNLVQKDCVLSFNLICEERAIQKFVSLGFVCSKEKCEGKYVNVPVEKAEKKVVIKKVKGKTEHYNLNVLEKNKDVVELYNIGKSKLEIADLLDITEWKVRFAIRRIGQLYPNIFDPRKEYEEKIKEEIRIAKEEKRVPKIPVIKHEGLVKAAKIRGEKHKEELLEKNAYLIELYNKNEKTIPVLAKSLGITVKRFNHVISQIRKNYPDALISRVSKKYSDDVLTAMIRDEEKYPTYESIANALNEPYINVKMAIYRIGEKYGIKREKKHIDKKLVECWNDLEKFPTKKDVMNHLNLTKCPINQRLAKLRRAGYHLIERKDRRIFIKNFETVWNDKEKYPSMYSVKKEFKRCGEDVLTFAKMLKDRGVFLIERT
jgi:hypothetical protein